jgi:hypothetical protein
MHTHTIRKQQQQPENNPKQNKNQAQLTANTRGKTKTEIADAKK